MTSPHVEQAAASSRTEDEARAAKTLIRRRTETARLQPGQRITYSGFPGSVTLLYSDGPTEAARMYEVRLPGGSACVCGSDLIPAEG